MVRRRRVRTNCTCYLCGSKQADTRDHIFPKNLFPRPMPANLPTGPACRESNNSFSDDEELFRALVTSGMAYETTSGRHIWDKRVRPSLQQNRRGFKTLLRKLVTEVKLPSGSALALEFKPERVNRVLSKIAKGLYYIDRGESLPNNVKLLFRYDEPRKLIEPPLDEAIKGAKKTVLGENVIVYWRNTVEGDPANSMTWLVFNRFHCFLILTYTENVLENAD